MTPVFADTAYYLALLNPRGANGLKQRGGPVPRVRRLCFALKKRQRRTKTHDEREEES